MQAPKPHNATKRLKSHAPKPHNANKRLKGHATKPRAGVPRSLLW
jgi:hypothetical protein